MNWTRDQRLERKVAVEIEEQWRRQNERDGSLTRAYIAALASDDQQTVNAMRQAIRAMLDRLNGIPVIEDS